MIANVRASQIASLRVIAASPISTPSSIRWRDRHARLCCVRWTKAAMPSCWTSWRLTRRLSRVIRRHAPSASAANGMVESGWADASASGR